eukprot:4594353-Prymnesium_polylepis.1
MATKSGSCGRFVELTRGETARQSTADITTELREPVSRACHLGLGAGRCGLWDETRADALHVDQEHDPTL